MRNIALTLLLMLACRGAASPLLDNYTTFIINPAATSASFLHSCSGASRIIVLQITMNGTSANVNVNSASYAGSALTFVRQDRANSRTTEIWYAIAPATGNNTVSLNLQASVITQIICMSFNQASQTANPGVSNFAPFTSATTASITYTSTANDSLILENIFWNSLTAQVTPYPDSFQIVQITNTWRQQARYEDHETPIFHEHDISFDTAQSGGYGVLEIIDDENTTHTFTNTVTETFTISPTFSESPTETPTYTISETHTFSPTTSPTPTITRTITPLPSATFTKSQTFTVSPTPTATRTVTPTPSVTRTHTFSPTISPTFTITQTFTISPTFSMSPTNAETATATPTITQTFTYSPTATPSRTPIWTRKATPVPVTWTPRIRPF